MSDVRTHPQKSLGYSPRSKDRVLFDREPRTSSEAQGRTKGSGDGGSKDVEAGAEVSEPIGAVILAIASR